MWAWGGGTGAPGGRKERESVAAEAPGQCPAEGVTHSPEDAPLSLVPPMKRGCQCPGSECWVSVDLSHISQG